MTAGARPSRRGRGSRPGRCSALRAGEAVGGPSPPARDDQGEGEAAIAGATARSDRQPCLPASSTIPLQIDHGRIYEPYAEFRPSAGFCTTTAAAYATAAMRQRPAPQLAPTPCCDVDTPMIAVPADATAHPARNRLGKPSRSIRPASNAISIGPTLTSIAAVPASTRLSASLSATLYTTSQSTPYAAIRVRSLRTGSGSRLTSASNPSHCRPRAGARGRGPLVRTNARRPGCRRRRPMPTGRPC
jgi:hypothetical protein